MLKLDVRVGDAVEIDDGRITIRVEDKSGQRTRLAFDAPRDVKIRMLEDKPVAAVPRKVLPPLVR
jgi:sRNA-binding carbon storage regulator CsrA